MHIGGELSRRDAAVASLFVLCTSLCFISRKIDCQIAEGPFDSRLPDVASLVDRSPKPLPGPAHEMHVKSRSSSCLKLPRCTSRGKRAASSRYLITMPDSDV